MLPMISIVVPIYNARPHLSRCLDSLFKQTMLELEYLLVDDASTDLPEEEIEAAIERFPARRYSVKKIVHQENRGVSAARQSGLDAANGKYVIFADPDDYMECDMYESLFLEAENHKADMVWQDFFLDRNEECIRVSQVQKESANHLIDSILQSELHGATWNKLFHRHFLIEHNVRFPSERITLCEDLYFLCNFLKYCPIVRYLDKCSYHYCEYESSATHRLTLQSLISLQKVGKMLDELKLSQDHQGALVFWKKGVRFTGCFADRIPDDFFLVLFPEHRDLKGLPVNFILKLLFHLAQLGCRAEALAIYRPLMKLKNSLK